MAATLKTTVIQEPSSGTVNMTLGSTGGVTFGAAATTNTITSAAATALTIQSAGTTAMTIDTSQNVGIGTTSPSSYNKLTVGTFSNLDGTGILYQSAPDGVSGGALNFFAYNNSTPIKQAYIQTVCVSGTVGSEGSVMKFATIGSGTLAERMRIDSSGNLLVGTTSQIGGARVNFVQPNSSTDMKVVVGVTTGTNSPYLAFVSNTTSVVGTENSSGGNLVSGSSAYATILSNGGAYPIQFGTNNTIRATIDSSGNLLVGTTTSSYGKLEVDVNISGAGGASRFINNGTTGYTGELVQMITGQGASTAYSILACYYSGGGAYAFRVRGDGTLFAQNTTVQSASDQRLKENIVDATDGLNIITALKPRRFDWKEGQGNGKKNQLGFIAQEIEQVFPEATDVWGESNDPSNPYKSVGPSALIPVLVKAIQELSAKVDAQAAEITALQAKVGA